jgi:hypothetical protein
MTDKSKKVKSRAILKPTSPLIVMVPAGKSLKRPEWIREAVVREIEEHWPEKMLSLNQFLLTHKHEDAEGRKWPMPLLRTVISWQREDPEINRRIETTRQYWADVEVDGLVDELSDDSKDIVELTPDKWMSNSARVSRLNAKASHIRWLASKINPDKYGDRSKVEMSGGLDLFARQMSEAIQSKEQGLLPSESTVIPDE